ncbi:MAG TPA: type II toxin-antitoxin system RelE/ParE family toxin, partial [Alphaproteobacteria bacterium]
MRVVWTDRAGRHLEAIKAYIAEDNPTAAERMSRAIFAAVERLEDFPGMGRPGRRRDTRELVVSGTPFVVLYTVEGDQ